MSKESNIKDLFDQISESSKKNEAHFPTIGILTIVFVVLKLCHVITWSWIWVLSPIWILFCVALITLIFLIILYGKK